MVPRCSATWRAEYKRVRPSNRGPASHVEVSPISDSNEFMVGFPATSESNDLMTGSCRFCIAVLLAISIPRFCVTGAAPAPWIHVLASPMLARAGRLGTLPSGDDLGTGSRGSVARASPGLRRRPPGHGAGPDPYPERALHGGHPRVQPELAQPLDLGFLIDHFRAASDHYAPSGPGLLVVLVGFEGDQVSPLGRGELRPAGRSEDWVLPGDNVVHRQDHHLAIREEAHPPDRDRGQQLQAHVERQYLQPRVIGRMSWHFAPPLMRPLAQIPRARPGWPSCPLTLAHGGGHSQRLKSRETGPLGPRGRS